MRAATFVVCMLGSSGLAGCFTTTQDGAGVLSSGGAAGGAAAGGCAGSFCRKGNGGAAGGGGSSGGASKGTSGSSAGGTSGGAAASTGGTSGGLGDAGIDCPDLYLTSTVFDLATRTPLVGATISAVQLDGVPITGSAASTAADGTFVLCVPSSEVFTVQVTAQNYPQSDLEDCSLTTSDPSFFAKGIPLLSQSDLTAIQAFVPYKPTLGAVLVSVNSFSGMAPCQDAAGWQLTLGFPDGGTLPDGGPLQYDRVYLGNDFLPDMSLTATASNGNAFFYGIDPAATGRVRLSGVDTNADAGACPFITSQFGLQSTAVVGAQVLTFAPLFVP